MLGQNLIKTQTFWNGSFAFVKRDTEYFFTNDAYTYNQHAD